MKIKLFINFLKKKNFFFIILLLITVYSLYDRAIWSNISVWQADEATSMWLGLTKSISNMPVGLISSEGFPNPNGMIIFAKAFSYLPSLWSVSFVLSFIQFFLILILGYILFKNDNRFYLFILPIVFCVALRSTSVQFANQYVLTSVNLLYFILLIIYLKKPSPLKFIFLLMPIIIGPAIYLAGLANSFAFLICSLFALFLYPPEKKLINLIMASVVGLILITLSIIFTWEPYFNTLTLNLTPTNKLDKLFISLFTIVKFPYWSVVYGAGEIVGSFKQNGFDSKVYPYWSLFHMNDEGWKWYLKYGGHLTNQSVLALRISSIFIIAQSILSCLVLIIAPLIHLIKYGSLQNVLISNKKKENQFLLLIILFIISLLFFGTLLGSTGWIDGKRLDQQVQFLPLLILIWFMVPNVFNISKFLNKIVYRCSLFFCFFYILLNIIGGHLITRDYLEYTGPIISEADIPLVQKKQAVKYIAEDWKLNSNSQKVPIGFYFPAKIWSWINEFGEKYSPFYPNVYILGREYDYELLRIYNLYNSQEGIQHRTFNGVKYIICYKAYPLQIKKALVSEVKIFGQLMVIKLKSI